MITDLMCPSSQEKAMATELLGLYAEELEAKFAPFVNNTFRVQSRYDPDTGTRPSLPL